MANENSLAKEEAKAKKPADKNSRKSSSKKPKKSIAKYFKDLRSEFKKVVWPSKKTVFNNTLVVLITLIVTGLFIWGLDTLFAVIIKLALGLSVKA